MKLATRKSLSRKLRAALACGAATGSDFALLTILIRLAGAPTFLAALLGAGLGAGINFVLQRHLVFRAAAQKKRRQLPGYLAIAGTTMLLSAGATALLADVAGLHELAARAIAAVAVFLCWHYPLARRLFRNRPNTVTPTGTEREHAPIGLETSTTGGHAMKPYLSVIIPAYNEEKRLPATLQDIETTLGRLPVETEVIVVDDGSSDGTADVVRRLADERDEKTWLRLVSYKPNGGKGLAVRRGIFAARGELVLFMDADNSVPLGEAEKLIHEIEGGIDAAIGSRYADPDVTEVAQPWYRVAWSRLANFFVQGVLLRGIRDTQCGFKAFRAGPARRVFDQVTITGWGFDLEVLTLFDRMGYSIVEVPVPFRDDRGTKINPLKDAWGVVRDFLTVQGNLLRGKYRLDRPTPMPARS